MLWLMTDSKNHKKSLAYFQWLWVSVVLSTVDCSVVGEKQDDRMAGFTRDGRTGGESGKNKEIFGEEQAAYRAGGRRFLPHWIRRGRIEGHTVRHATPARWRSSVHLYGHHDAVAAKTNNKKLRKIYYVQLFNTFIKNCQDGITKISHFFRLLNSDPDNLEIGSRKNRFLLKTEQKNHNAVCKLYNLQSSCTSPRNVYTKKISLYWLWSTSINTIKTCSTKK